MNHNRKLVYRFLELTHVRRMDVVMKLGLAEPTDKELEPNERNTLYFRRATERGILAQMWDAIEEQYEDDRATENPFAKKVEADAPCSGSEAKVMSDGYKPIPVDVARQIAKEFRKDIVVIYTEDDVFALSHITTYGSTTLNTLVAAERGEAITKTFQMDMTRKQSFEDFRDVSQAEAAKEIERLTALLNEKEAEIQNILKDYLRYYNC